MANKLSSLELVKKELDPVLVYEQAEDLFAVLVRVARLQASHLPDIKVQLGDAQRHALRHRVAASMPTSLPPWIDASSISANDALFEEYLNPSDGWYFVVVDRTVEPSPLSNFPLSEEPNSVAPEDMEDSPRAGMSDGVSLRHYLAELESAPPAPNSAYSFVKDTRAQFKIEPSATSSAKETVAGSSASAFRRLSCRVLSSEDASSPLPPFSCHPNFASPLCFVALEGRTVSLHAHSRFTLDSMFRFSKDILSSDSSKQYVAEQLLRGVAHLHQRGLCHGALSPTAICLSDAFWVRIIGARDAVTFDSDGCARAAVESEGWAEKLEKWARGRLSNYDYLLILNSLAGRRVGDPNFHPVFPWVIDFKTPKSWRDLTTSKYRQTKGDEQLDLTYTASAAAGSALGSDREDGHHVSDIMSELTYFNYFARRMPIWVLQRYVRTNFQASEYPASMERLFSWSPDECIPEFFQDGQPIVSSVHEGMPDIALPEWANNDWATFVAHHRAALESDHVSAHLHHWIDITFGYKLSGDPGKTAKNVALMDRSKQRSSGYIQLFSSPHPPRAKATEMPLDALSTAEQVARFIGHADRLESLYHPCVDRAALRFGSWTQFCDLVAIGAIVYQLTTGQPLLHGRSWLALDARLRGSAGNTPHDWEWWCSSVATETSRIASHRVSSLIFRLVFRNQQQVLRSGGYTSLSQLLAEMSPWERKGLDLVYGFAARFEEIRDPVERARQAVVHVGVLTNQLPLWAVNLIVPYLLPFFRNPKTQGTALELIEPLAIILGRSRATRLLLDHICTLYESYQSDSPLYGELVSFKVVGVLVRQLGQSTILSRLVPHLASALRHTDTTVSSRASECVRLLVASLGPHIFAKHVLSVVVQQLSKQGGDVCVPETILDIASQIGDDYCCVHILPLLLSVLQRSLFSRAEPSLDDFRSATAALRIVSRILELPILLSSPLRVVKALVIDQPLLLALLVYPHLVDRTAYSLVIDCVFSLSRCVGTSWAVRHIRPFVASAADGGSYHAPQAPSMGSLPGTSAQSIGGLDLLVSSGWSVFGPPGAFCSPTQRASVANKFSELLETSPSDDALSNWAAMVPVLDSFELPSEPDADSPVVVSVRSDLPRDSSLSTPVWLASIPMGSAPPVSVPLPGDHLATEPDGRAGAVYPRSTVDQLQAWLNPKRAATWSFSGNIAASWKEHTGSIRQLAVHDSERLVLSASRDGSVKCWDVYGDGTNSKISYWGHKSSPGGAPSSVCFVDRGGVVASCDVSIHVWELERATKVMQIDHASASFQCLCPLFDGRVVAAATTQATVSLTDLRSPHSDQCEWLLPNNQSGLPRVVAPVLHDGYLLAVGQSSGYVTVIDTRSGLLLYSWHAHDGAVLDLKPWNDGQNAFLFSCSQDKSVSLWNIHSQLPAPTLWNTATNSVPTTQGSPVLANLPSLQCTYKGHRDSVVCFDTFQDCLFSASGHKVSLSPIMTQHAQIKLDRKRLLKPSLKPNYITCMAALPNTQLLLLGTEDGQVRVAY